MTGLGERIVALELLVAAQAVELRGSGPLGRGTRRVFEAVRERARSSATAIRCRKVSTDWSSSSTQAGSRRSDRRASWPPRAV